MGCLCVVESLAEDNKKPPKAVGLGGALTTSKTKQPGTWIHYNAE